MIHVHKEIYVEHEGIKRWAHEGTVYLKLFTPEIVRRFASKCFVGCGDTVSELTQKDIEFLYPEEIYTVCNIPEAQKLWDKIMPTPFNYHFGCWPWDFADQLNSPDIKKALKDLGILDFRMVILL